MQRSCGRNELGRFEVYQGQGDGNRVRECRMVGYEVREVDRARTFSMLEAKVRILFFILRATGSLRILSREETYQIFILERSF